MISMELLNDNTITVFGGIVVALIMIVPSTIAALGLKYSRDSKKAAESTRHEVMDNGGMSDPDPTLKDYIKFVSETLLDLSDRVQGLESEFREYMRHQNSKE